MQRNVYSSRQQFRTVSPLLWRGAKRSLPLEATTREKACLIQIFEIQWPGYITRWAHFLSGTMTITPLSLPSNVKGYDLQSLQSWGDERFTHSCEVYYITVGIWMWKLCEKNWKVGKIKFFAGLFGVFKISQKLLRNYAFILASTRHEGRLEVKRFWPQAAPPFVGDTEFVHSTF